MNKTEFPLNTELPLRGGGVAVLYEFFDGHWFGRRRSIEQAWSPSCWGWRGNFWPDQEHLLDILPPKRRAWVVWYPDDDDKHSFRKTAEIVTSAEYASLRAKELGGTYQELTEP